MGDRIPTFALKKAQGDIVKSGDLLARGAMVVIVFRGGWWPYSNVDLYALQGILNELEKLGASLVVLTPRKSEHNRLARTREIRTCTC